MCNCGAKLNTYQPLYKQVWTKDRLGKPVLTKVPLPNQKLKRQLKRLRQQFLEKKNAVTLEEQIDLALK